MKTSKALLITLLATAAIWGCNKEGSGDTPSPTPTPTPTSSVFQQLFTNNIAAAMQGFSLSAATGGQLVGSEGTRLDFEPGAFRYANGALVTGQVDVTLVEVMGIGDMIWLNKQTVGNDNGIMRLLRSGGAINVTASQGGNTLRITQGGLVVRIPTQVGDPAMQLFSGNEDASGRMIWNPIDSSSVTVVPEYVDLSYYFAADSLQWINCDYFYSYPSTTTLTATIPAGQSTDSTQIWVAFPTENAVMQMSHSNAQSYASWQVVPVGMQAVIVGLHRTVNGDYSSFTPVTITSNMDVPLTFTPTTLAQFQAALNAL